MGTVLYGQDPAGNLEGQVTDASGGSVHAAKVAVRNLETGYEQYQVSPADGLFRFVSLPVGTYTVTVEAAGFARFTRTAMDIPVSSTIRLNVRLEVGSTAESITVEGGTSFIDTATNTLGKVVSGREILDLPLNGRNFTQLGLLQSGVAPVTSGVATAGGSLRAGQAYAVNGQRPESNRYLLDGTSNVNRMDGGFGLKIPVDAIAEFRILTHTAPPEYGGNSGSVTSVVTKGGSNQVHGTLYEFFRNDKLDARNYFSRDVEPLKQNQFGATLGGPLKSDHLFYFGYYEGFRNRQGYTQSATVPTPEQRAGNFSNSPTPLVNFASGGTRFPNDQIPASLFNPIAQNVIALYPLGNVSPTVYRATVVQQNNSDQGGGRVDFNRSERDQFSARYAFSAGDNLNPISVRGSDLPGFPVKDHLQAQSAALSSVHTFSPSLTNSLRAGFFRYIFDFDQRLNTTPPSAFGFPYDSASALGQGPPFFNINGYSSIGGAITGPRLSTQNTWDVSDGLSWFRGKHSLKLGGGLERTQINAFQAIAPNAFFVFAPSFPTNDAFANLLLGKPVVFYQGLGDLGRGLRGLGTNLFVQDEWRVSRRLTLNYGVRWEVIEPYAEIRNRLNAFEPGVQSQVMPNAPKGLLFPGDPGIANGIAPNYYKGFMPRTGLAWDPSGTGVWSIRASYGIFYDPYSNGAGLATQAPVSSLPWTQFYQLSGPTLNFSDPYAGRVLPDVDTFAHPSTVVVLDEKARPPYAQDWNLSIERSIRGKYLVEARYVGTKGTRLPRNIEANPSIFGPGATVANADRRRLYANCGPNNGPCDFSTVDVLSYVTNSTYHAGQISLSRRYSAGLAFNVSYWYSKSLDYLSAINLSGSAAKPLSGENDVAQNPFDLRAEHGPSLFDATHRFVASGGWELPFGRRARGYTKALFGGWQANAIASFNSGTPFTVGDSANVALQGNNPPISGYASSRPDLIGDPNRGPHTVDQWISPANFRRLNPASEAGKFGNAGRNIVRGPSFGDVDVSLVKTMPIRESVQAQFRAESFNVANHANFGLPLADLASPNFGRILQAGPPRLTQFALKLLF